MSVVTKTATAQAVEHVTTAMREQGICSTCRHEPRCLFVKAARQTIWQCEEFCAGGDTAPAHHTAPLPSSGEGQPVGLCADCAERGDCSQRQPGVLVTECADYR
jgi:ribosomal protein L37AE/L43A